MQSKAKNVAAYLAELPPERRPALTQLRELCLQELRGYAEGMQYGMPCYSRDGKHLVCFASQKQYLSLYGIRSEVRERHRDALARCIPGKGCIRFRSVKDLDFAVVQALLRETADAS